MSHRLLKIRERLDDTDIMAVALKCGAPKDIDVQAIWETLKSCDEKPYKYMQWLTSCFLRGHLSWADVVAGGASETAEILRDFTAMRSHIEDPQFRSIMKYKTPKDIDIFLRPYIQKYADRKGSRQSKKENSAYAWGCSITGETMSGLRYVVPTTKKAAAFHGLGTKWCTSSAKGDAFISHASESPLVVFIMPSGRKYQGCWVRQPLEDHNIRADINAIWNHDISRYLSLMDDNDSIISEENKEIAPYVGDIVEVMMKTCQFPDHMNREEIKEYRQGIAEFIVSSLEEHLEAESYGGLAVENDRPIKKKKTLDVTSLLTDEEKASHTGPFIVETTGEIQRVSCKNERDALEFISRISGKQVSRAYAMPKLHLEAATQQYITPYICDILRGGLHEISPSFSCLFQSIDDPTCVRMIGDVLQDKHETVYNVLLQQSKTGFNKVSPAMYEALWPYCQKSSLNGRAIIAFRHRDTIDEAMKDMGFDRDFTANNLNMVASILGTLVSDGCQTSDYFKKGSDTSLRHFCRDHYGSKLDGDLMFSALAIINKWVSPDKITEYIPYDASSAFVDIVRAGITPERVAMWSFINDTALTREDRDTIHKRLTEHAVPEADIIKASLILEILNFSEIHDAFNDNTISRGLTLLPETVRASRKNEIMKTIRERLTVSDISQYKEAFEWVSHSLSDYRGILKDRNVAEKQRKEHEISRTLRTISTMETWEQQEKHARKQPESHPDISVK